MGRLTWAEAAARLHIDLLTVSWVFIPFAACVAVCWFCWRRGDPTDRIVAATFGGCWLAVLISIWTSALLLDDVRPPLFWRVIWAAIAGTVFLWAAVGRRKSWYGVAAIAQGLQMAIKTVDITLHEPAGPLAWTLFYISEAMNPVMMAAMVAAVLGFRRAAPGPALR